MSRENKASPLTAKKKKNDNQLLHITTLSTAPLFPRPHDARHSPSQAERSSTETHPTSHKNTFFLGGVAPKTINEPRPATNCAPPMRRSPPNPSPNTLQEYPNLRTYSPTRFTARRTTPSEPLFFFFSDKNHQDLVKNKNDTYNLRAKSSPSVRLLPLPSYGR